MSAAVETKHDVEVLEALDFEPDVKCDPAPSYDCPNAGVVYVICRGCRDTHPACTHHLSNLRAFAASVPSVRCRACKRDGALDFVVEFVPVKGGA